MSNILTKALEFQPPSARPFFFTSYVSTIDGKIFVKKPGYWPIGSKTDFTYYTYLRAHADVIVEGKNTALGFGNATIKTLHSEQFLAFRKELNKEKPCDFIILSRNFDEQFKEKLQNDYGYKPTIITASAGEVFESIKDVATIERVDKDRSFVISVLEYLKKKKYRTVFLDVGPVLLAEFIHAGALDELFLTIAPKLVGTDNDTVSLGDFSLFPANILPSFSLISNERVDDEIFLRYRIKQKE